MKLTVTLKKKGETGVEGTYRLPSSSAAKLQRKDGSSQFPNTSALKTTAHRLGKTLGLEVEFVEPARKAAKKSVKRTVKTTSGTPTASTTTPASSN